MTRRDSRVPIASSLAVLCACAALGSCHAASPFPWDASQAPRSMPSSHADVRTLNTAYDRLHSHVLVREVARPTRANLDYAAYYANFMIADPEPEARPEANGAAAPARPAFGDAIDNTTLTSDVSRTGLTPEERSRPLAFGPLVEYLLAQHVDAAERLEQLAAAVREESWGQPATPGLASQAISLAFLHSRPDSQTELWLKVEFAPWLRADLPDQDGDGVPEVYGRARADRLSPSALARIHSDYAARVLTRDEVTGWANQLASYWYPSFNTDLLVPTATWPDEQTEAAIRKELGAQTFSGPSVVMRGKPQGEATYAVLLIASTPADGDPKSAAHNRGLVLAKTSPTPDPRTVAADIARELAVDGGGAWPAWTQKLAPFSREVQRRLARTPARIKALPGEDGFLFYRKSLEAVVGGDLTRQPAGKNPLPIIVEYKQALAALGVDFLFVPVPTKLEVFPDEFDPKSSPLVGQVVNPWSRKFLLDLAEHNVEVVDLLPDFLAARGADDAASGQEPLFQRQDTHWSARGLELAADRIAARIQRYPWYQELSRHAQQLGTRRASFTRFGDLHSRLPQSAQKAYRPETLEAHQVLRADGSLYEDDADSPVVVLGDSFTGVYELTDAEHAGLSAHIARKLGYPVDLVMSYGGGPNVRNKLMRRGTAELAKKKLVVWVMAARDLHDYWENWEPLAKP